MTNCDEILAPLLRVRASRMETTIVNNVFLGCLFLLANFVLNTLEEGFS